MAKSKTAPKAVKKAKELVAAKLIKGSRVISTAKVGSYVDVKAENGCTYRLLESEFKAL